jgi:hypothetical protein
MKGTAEISFDCVLDEDEVSTHFEGCYRRPGDIDWLVFYVTNQPDGLELGVLPDATFSSGIRGLMILCPSDRKLSKAGVKQMIADAIGEEEWIEVRGPDSLFLK